LLYGVRPGRLADCSLMRNSEVDAICLNPSGERGERIESMSWPLDSASLSWSFRTSPFPGLPDACFVRQNDSGAASALAKEHMRGSRTAQR
jgi:hypothetical protein